jgi:hypothetical protein
MTCRMKILFPGPFGAPQTEEISSLSRLRSPVKSPALRLSALFGAVRVFHRLIFRFIDQKTRRAGLHTPEYPG